VLLLTNVNHFKFSPTFTCSLYVLSPMTFLNSHSWLAHFATMTMANYKLIDTANVKISGVAHVSGPKFAQGLYYEL
jgi:hypothetical protein